MIVQVGVNLKTQNTSFYVQVEEIGDGSTRGNCPTNPSDLLCHSNEHCNVCRSHAGVHVGCETLSSTPVCDADSTTLKVDDSALEKRAACVGCKLDGKISISTVLVNPL